jgi:FKBP-type peptidyl-prolyl cis-trans isomerase 2
MAPAKSGDTVKVHYTGKLTDGTIFDSSADREPLEFKLGAGQIISGFEEAVLGMKPGDSTTTKIPKEKAYGGRNEENIFVVERERLPEDVKPEVGQMLTVSQSDGSSFDATVTEMNDTEVTLDGNHPLAGKELIFDIELVEII